MSMTVFWCEWDKTKIDSHELLRLALEQYLGQYPVALAEERSRERGASDSVGAGRFQEGNAEREKAGSYVLGISDASKIQMNQKDAIRFSLVKTEKGKPYFENSPQVKFSISHSGNLWACAFGETEVGLDLQSEYMKNGEKIARRFFHPEEIAWLEKNGFAQFSRVWTHKESCVKFTGAGLAEGLDYFSVVPWLEENEVCDGNARLCQQEIPFREGFWMVLTSGEPQEIVVRQLSGSFLETAEYL